VRPACFQANVIVIVGGVERGDGCSDGVIAFLINCSARSLPNAKQAAPCRSRDFEM
jgi:hypothetical protein